MNAAPPHRPARRCCWAYSDGFGADDTVIASARPVLPRHGESSRATRQTLQRRFHRRPGQKEDAPVLREEDQGPDGGEGERRLGRQHHLRWTGQLTNAPPPLYLKVMQGNKKGRRHGLAREGIATLAMPSLFVAGLTPRAHQGHLPFLLIAQRPLEQGQRRRLGLAVASLPFLRFPGQENSDCCPSRVRPLGRCRLRTRRRARCPRIQ